MKLTSVYPVLMSADVAAAAAFYRDLLGFETTFAADWYVSLRQGLWELALLDPNHPTIPEGFRGTPAAGVLINLEVADVDAVHQDLTARGASIARPLQSEDFGQRHFILQGPDGVLIDVITPIPPQGEYVEQFSEGEAVVDA
ncbi:VOC family protein [Microlunatus speluncae]|uniref:VOC family protein n=1 Tax=Microlunatus speluncae TaxID=2594267 RepID=UPI0012665A0D|nr:VOC family protein [Microlunatus speluncae]